MRKKEMTRGIGFQTEAFRNSKRYGSGNIRKNEKT